MLVLFGVYFNGEARQHESITVLLTIFVSYFLYMLFSYFFVILKF